jgi:hypothetical protein
MSEGIMGRLFFNKYKKETLLMKKIINKLKKLIGLSQSEYIIYYTDNLTQEQKSELMNRMISKFPGNCRPNRLTVGQKVAILDFSAPCLTGEALKIVSDNTLSPKVADITSIKLDGNEIWSKS